MNDDQKDRALERIEDKAVALDRIKELARKSVDDQAIGARYRALKAILEELDQ